ncbi:MAG: hypothetical protein ACE5HV_08170 [Acidobacteriota bacterium]
MKGGALNVLSELEDRSSDGVVEVDSRAAAAWQILGAHYAAIWFTLLSKLAVESHAPVE